MVSHRALAVAVWLLAARLAAAPAAIADRWPGDRSPTEAQVDALSRSDGVDAYLITDLQTLVRMGVAVGAVLGPELSLHAPAPRLVSATGPRDARDALAWLSDRWTGVLTISERPVARVGSPSAPTCQAALAQTVETTAIGGTATEVVFGLAKAIDPSLATLGPPGLLQGGGSTSRSPYKVARDAVQLTGGRSTVAAALDQFVTRLDGWGWWVEERCQPLGRCACRVGMFTEDSVLAAVYDISPPATRDAPH